MKVFLSWSGKLSRDIAVAFHDWLPYVIQSVKPFVSTGDIDKGKRWSEVLGDELQQIAYGIIILTRENIREPWINFEAGAISKAIEKSCVSPLCFGVDPAKIDGPLQQFQATIYDRDDIFNLLRSVNARVDEEHQVSFEVLRKEFDAWWPDLQKRVDEILATQQVENETGFDWLYTTKDLARHMTTPKNIWVVAQHLYRNALVSPVRDVMAENLKAGATYTFIVSSADDSAELQRISAAAPGRVQVVQITEEEFQNAAVTDYFILEPDSDGLTVLLELPIAARGYWIEVDREAAIGLVGRFRKYASRSPIA